MAPCARMAPEGDLHRRRRGKCCPFCRQGFLLTKILASVSDYNSERGDQLRQSGRHNISKGRSPLDNAVAGENSSDLGQKNQLIRCCPETGLPEPGADAHGIHQDEMRQQSLGFVISEASPKVPRQRPPPVSAHRLADYARSLDNYARSLAVPALPGPNAHAHGVHQDEMRVKPLFWCANAAKPIVPVPAHRHNRGVYESDSGQE